MKPKKRTHRREMAVTSEAGERFRHYVECLAVSHNAERAEGDAYDRLVDALGAPKPVPWATCESAPSVWRQAHLPAIGAQRRLEGRIGQLLGPAEHGGDRRSDQNHRDDLGPISHSQDRSDFRILARALYGRCELTKDERRQSPVVVPRLASTPA